MKYFVVWMDHAKAHVVKADSTGTVTIENVESGVESHHHFGEPDGEHVSISSQHRSDNVHNNQMKAFVKTLIHKLADAEEIHIMGPGNAKFDLKNGLEEEKSMHGKLKSCETTDKMTENQLIAHVKKACGLE